jgi:hypothetical protein
MAVGRLARSHGSTSRRRQRTLDARSRDARQSLRAELRAAAEVDDVGDFLDRKVGDPLLAHSFRLQEVSRGRLSYPDDARDTMPTLLGNVQRRHEVNAGCLFGLDILQVAPYLSIVAPQEQTSYVDDAREEMDTATSIPL